MKLKLQWLTDSSYCSPGKKYAGSKGPFDWTNTLDYIIRCHIIFRIVNKYISYHIIHTESHILSNQLWEKIQKTFSNCLDTV